MANDSQDSILKNTSIITMMTLISRVTGLIRTWAMAFALGNTLLTSAYQIAYNLPMMIYELAANGLLATAFLPLYLLRKEEAGENEARKFASNILSMTILGLGALALACSVFSPLVIETQTFTVDNGNTKELATFFFRVFAIQILFYGVGAVITGILNAERIFVAPSFAPVLNNIVVIITMFGYVPISSIDSTFAMWWLAIGTSTGVLVQFGAQIPALIKQGFRYKPHINLHDPMLKEALKVALPIFVYIAGTMITFSFRNAFSLEAAENGPSTLSYAWMWFQLPYGVIAVSLSTTMLTEMSDCVAREDWDGFRSFVRRGLRSTFFLIIPLAALIGALSTYLMQLFQAGAFTAEEAQNVGAVLAVWVLALPFYAGYMYMYRVLGALRSFVVFTAVDFAMRFVQAGLYYVLCKPDMLGLLGVPVGDFVFYGVLFIACTFIVRSKVGSYGNRGIILLVLKVIFAASVAYLVTVIVSMVTSAALEYVALNAIIEALIIIAASGIIGLVVAFGICKLLNVDEFELLSKIGNRLFGKLLKRA